MPNVAERRRTGTRGHGDAENLQRTSGFGDLICRIVPIDFLICRDRRVTSTRIDAARTGKSPDGTVGDVHVSNSRSRVCNDHVAGLDVSPGGIGDHDWITISVINSCHLIEPFSHLHSGGGGCGRRSVRSRILARVLPLEQCKEEVDLLNDQLIGDLARDGRVLERLVCSCLPICVDLRDLGGVERRLGQNYSSRRLTRNGRLEIFQLGFQSVEIERHQ